MTRGKAGVIGAGAWGTALAQVCARAGLDTVLWAREPEVVASIAEARENTLFLPGVTLHENLIATGDMAALADADFWLAVAPAQHLRASLAAFAPHAPGKWLADIYRLARIRLQHAGVQDVHGGGRCTFGEADRFYSYRRDGVTGRMASLIWRS